MRLLLARHGETVDNVAGIYAGTTDSPLTNHGVFQASRLGSHLAANGVVITNIFSSDLQRAFKTAEAVRIAQKNPPAKVKQVKALREQDFGIYEGKHFSQRPKEGGKSGKDAHLEVNRRDEVFRDVENKASMTLRVNAFLDEHLLKIVEDLKDRDDAVLVVAHGIILNHLWRALLRRFHPRDVSAAPGVLAADQGMSLEYLIDWSNTGYLDLEIKSKSCGTLASTAISSSSESPPATKPSLPESEPPTGPPTNSPSNPKSPQRILNSTKPALLLSNLILAVKSVNTLIHLQNLKKTRGGLGSLKHDSSQTTMDSFFKKRKIG